MSSTLEGIDNDDVAKRVKFQVEFRGGGNDDDDNKSSSRDDDDNNNKSSSKSKQQPQENEWLPLSKALEVSEQVDAAPISSQGYIFGNGAILSSSSNSIVVSKSGRRGDSHGFTVDDFVRVIDFDIKTWKAVVYYDDDGGCSKSTTIIKPSSDTPLLWNALMVAPQKFNWPIKPKFVLHSHSCSTIDDAKRLNIPTISSKETLFSTPDDLYELMELFQKYPYPQHQIYIRKGHGFFLLTQSSEEACEIVRTKLSNLNLNNNNNNDEVDEEVKEESSKVSNNDNDDNNKTTTTTVQPKKKAKMKNEEEEEEVSNNDR